jgi:hypothetical protein
MHGTPSVPLEKANVTGRNFDLIDFKISGFDKEKEIPAWISLW